MASEQEHSIRITALRRRAARSLGVGAVALSVCLLAFKKKQDKLKAFKQYQNEKNFITPKNDDGIIRNLNGTGAGAYVGPQSNLHSRLGAMATVGFGGALLTAGFVLGFRNQTRNLPSADAVFPPEEALKKPQQRFRVQITRAEATWSALRALGYGSLIAWGSMGVFVGSIMWVLDVTSFKEFGAVMREKAPPYGLWIRGKVLPYATQLRAILPSKKANGNIQSEHEDAEHSIETPEQFR